MANAQEIKEIKIETNLKKYGYKYFTQSPQIKEKIRNTCNNKYGGPCPYSSKEIRKKGNQTCFKKYGFDNFSKTEQGRLISRENYINLIEIQKLNGEPLTPRIGIKERLCLNDLQKYINYQIKRNPKIIGYFPDGWIEELKLDIEFDETEYFHNQINWKIRDKKRDQDFFSSYYNVIRIQESDWNENKELQIIKFQETIRFLQQIQKINN